MTTADFHTISAKGISATLDLRVGHVRSLVIERNGKRIEPLHSAPWVDDPAITGDETLLPNLRFLSGDFFCAPFSTADVDQAPPHGWPANSRWRLLDVTSHEAGGTTARYELEHDVLGARRILAQGTSADRQLASYANAIAGGATQQEALETVVDHLIAETRELS